MDKYPDSVKLAPVRKNWTPNTAKYLKKEVIHLLAVKQTKPTLAIIHLHLSQAIIAVQAVYTTP